MEELADPVGTVRFFCYAVLQVLVGHPSRAVCGGVGRSGSEQTSGLVMEIRKAVTSRG